MDAVEGAVEDAAVEDLAGLEADDLGGMMKRIVRMKKLRGGFYGSIVAAIRRLAVTLYVTPRGL